MLARVAENIYWMGRYVERMDGTARLINATTLMLMDSPEETRFSWPVLIDVFGEDSHGFIQEGSSSEMGVMHYLIEANDSPSSIRRSCEQVRLNARCVREMIPRDFWQEINSLHLFMQIHCKLASSRLKRYELMVEVSRRCQMVIGVMEGTMLRDDAFRLFNLGRNIERADMTTRIMDTLILQQLTPTDSYHHRREFYWISLLNALGGVEPYRRYFAQEEGHSEVMDFLMNYPLFPRSVVYCLDQITAIAGELPRPKSAIKTVATLRKVIIATPPAELTTLQLHALIDDIQAGLNQLHGNVTQDILKVSQH